MLHDEQEDQNAPTDGNELDKIETPNDSQESETDGFDEAANANLDDVDSDDFDDGFGDDDSDADDSDESERTTSKKEYVPSSVSKRQTRTYLMKR
ncbi:MAG: hypothetical protein Q4G59_02230, partial [Planctomycetia bacterium]|nr:hypothetical protein [Planctomycetia bacterium]